LLPLPWALYEQFSGPTSFLATSTFEEWAMLLTTGLTAWISLFFKAFALQLSHGLGVLVMWYLNSIFSILFDYLFFNKVIGMISLAGVLLVIFGCVVTICGNAILSSFKRCLPICCRRHSLLTTPTSTTPSSAEGYPVTPSSITSYYYRDDDEQPAAKVVAGGANNA